MRAPRPEGRVYARLGCPLRRPGRKNARMPVGWAHVEAPCCSLRPGHNNGDLEPHTVTKARLLQPPTSPKGQNAYIGVLEGAHCGLSSQRTGRVGHTTGNRYIAAALGRARDGGDRNATDGRPFVVRNQIPARIMKPRNRSDRLMALHVVFQDAFGTTG